MPHSVSEKSNWNVNTAKNWANYTKIKVSSLILKNALAIKSEL